MGTNSGWVVGWADLAALVALPVKPDEFGPGIRTNDIRFHLSCVMVVGAAGFEPATS